MRYVLLAALLVAPLRAGAATATDTADVTLTIAAYGTIEFQDDFGSVGAPFSNTDPEDRGDAVSSVTCLICTNDESWTAAFTIAADQTTGGAPNPNANLVSNIVADALIDTMPAGVAADAPLLSGGVTGNVGVLDDVTVTITRDGLSDANGTYKGKVTGTLTYD